MVHWSFTEPADAFMASRTLRLRVFDRVDGRLAHASDNVVLATKGQLHETIADIDLWYPKGYGRPALYDVELALVDGDRVIADWRTAFGFRTIALRNSEVVTPDGDGEFQFVVNGADIFCKGSNWVPLDALHSRDDARLDDTLALLADLNCNMIRCWGGNVYEGQRFYDFCDREGVMVWQDFSLACALYPQTEAFHAEMRAEAEAIVPLLRNHPSLALWAGNNEIDQFYPWAKPGVDPNADDLISRRVLPEVVRRLDPRRLYLPSSPYYSSKLWAGGNVRAAAEDHLWGPRDDFKGAFYTGSTARFASEIGYHGCPARSSLERMMRPEQLWPWQGSEDWLTHAVRPQPESTRYNYRIPLMAGQIGVLFDHVPTELDDFVLASQLSQAEALKFFIEMFRLEKGRRSGILWWNIKDGWPQISDAVVDYYGTRKLAYHIVRRLQRDVLVMASEAKAGQHRLVAINDTAEDVAIDVAVSVAGAAVFATRGRVVPANGRIEIGEVDERRDFTVFDIAWSGDHANGSNHYLAGPRPFDLKVLIALYRRILGDQPVDEQIASLGEASR
jgi:beta-mannosidase